MVRRDSGRKPSPEDLALWRKAVASARPLHLSASCGPAPPAKLRPAEPARHPAPKPTVPAPPKPLPGPDRKRAALLRRGKLKIEARIDLHGMTLAQAHPALIGFVTGAAQEGRRQLLVITGKGAGSDPAFLSEGRGVLRRQVPHWLRSAPLAPLILDVAQAHARHGGAGALYVTLRRRR